MPKCYDHPVVRRSKYQLHVKRNNNPLNGQWLPIISLIPEIKHDIKQVVGCTHAVQSNFPLPLMKGFQSDSVYHVHIIKLIRAGCYTKVLKRLDFYASTRRWIENNLTRDKQMRCKLNSSQKLRVSQSSRQWVTDRFTADNTFNITDKSCRVVCKWRS